MKLSERETENLLYPQSTDTCVDAISNGMAFLSWSQHS